MILLACMLLLVCDDGPVTTKTQLQAVGVVQKANAQSVLVEHPAEPEYWLGVSCADLPQFARLQFNLEGGVVVGVIAPDSPAATANLAQHDIITALNGDTIQDVTHLIELVQATAGQPVELDVIREGKPLKTKVTPARRAPRPVRIVMVSPDGKPLSEESAKLLDSLHKEGAAQTYSILVVRPGLVIPKEMLNHEMAMSQLNFIGDEDAGAHQQLPAMLNLESGTVTNPAGAPALGVLKSQLRTIQRGTVRVNDRQINLFPPQTDDKRVITATISAANPNQTAQLKLATPRIRIVHLVDEPKPAVVAEGRYQAFAGERSEVEKLRLQARKLQDHLQSVHQELEDLKRELQRIESEPPPGP